MASSMDAVNGLDPLSGASLSSPVKSIGVWRSNMTGLKDETKRDLARYICSHEGASIVTDLIPGLVDTC